MGIDDLGALAVGLLVTKPLDHGATGVAASITIVSSSARRPLAERVVDRAAPESVVAALQVRRCGRIMRATIAILVGDVVECRLIGMLVGWADRRPDSIDGPPCDGASSDLFTLDVAGALQQPEQIESVARRAAELFGDLPGGDDRIVGAADSVERVV